MQLCLHLFKQVMIYLEPEGDQEERHLITKLWMTLPRLGRPSTYSIHLEKKGNIVTSPIFSPSVKVWRTCDDQSAWDEKVIKRRHLASGNSFQPHHSFSIDIGRVGNRFFLGGGREEGDLLPYLFGLLYCTWWLPCAADVLHLSFCRVSCYNIECSMLHLIIIVLHRCWNLILVSSCNQCNQCRLIVDPWNHNATSASHWSVPSRKGIIHH